LKKRNDKSLRHKLRNGFLESIDNDTVAWSIIQEILDLQLIEALEVSLLKDAGEKNER
jgi:hypothetical protein